MSLLDFHQDALSQIFCGTGIPDWVVVAPNTFPSPLAAAFDFADPWQHPTRDQCNGIDNNNFPTYYISFSESATFGLLYNNETIRQVLVFLSCCRRLEGDYV